MQLFNNTSKSNFDTVKQGYTTTFRSTQHVVQKYALIKRKCKQAWAGQTTMELLCPNSYPWIKVKTCIFCCLQISRKLQ